jgi:hypothetical protein
MKLHNQQVPVRLRSLASRCLLGTVSAAMLYALPVIDSELGAGNGLVLNGLQVVAGEAERRPPPETRQSEVMTRRVYERIEKVIELRDAEDYAGARVILGEVREMFNAGRLNNRETQVMFQFYASMDMAEENYEGALANHREILKLENLTPELLEQTWTQIGAILYQLERYREAIDAFIMLNSITLEPQADVYLRIAYAHYQLEEFSEAIPPLLTNFELVRARGDQIPRNSYGLLRALYLTIEDFTKAYQITREMTVIFNEDSDWVLLAQLSAQLERFNDQSHLYYVSKIGGFLNSQGEYVTLASLLNNNDNPIGCGKVMEEAIKTGVVAEEESNLSLTATCYRLAREDAKAVPFLEKAASLSDDGELYAQLARVHMTIGDYEASLPAFDNAFRKGELSRPDQVYLLQARAFLELNRFEEAAQAARNAARDRRSADTARTWETHINNERERITTLQRQRRELAEFLR